MAENYPVLSGKEIFARIKQCLGPEKGIKDMAKDLKLKAGTVYGWNEKNLIPKTRDVFAISKYLGVSLYWLLTGADEKGLTEEQRKLLEDFENLNEQGKTLVVEHMEGLLRHFPQTVTSKKSTAG